MPIDIYTDIVINRPVGVVSAYAADPANAPEWYRNIESATWQTPPPVQAGSRIAFVARFLGRRLEYTYEVTELAPGERLVMRTGQGPFPMETTYTWTPAGDAATMMSLRNRGEPRGFASVAAPVLASAVRRATQADLRRLKSLLESDDGRFGPPAA
jgi:uncharacterized membrane protein